jgi:hypothetical protein
VEEREMEVVAREKRNERERGACMRGRAPGARKDRAGVGCATGRARPQARPTTHCSHSLTTNHI